MTIKLKKILFWLTAMIVLTLLAVGVWSLIFKGDTWSIWSLRWLQLLQSVSTFVLPPIAVVLLYEEQPYRALFGPYPSSESYTAHRPLYILSGILMMAIAMPAINLLSFLNQQLTLPAFLQPLEALMQQQETLAAEITERFLQADNFGGLLFNLLLMAIIPAMGEEMTFRGTMQPLISQPKIAIWVTAILFSFIHFQFYGFIPRMLMGALFGYMLLWTGSLWMPVAMHATNNALAVISYYICQRMGYSSDKLDALGSGDTLWLGILSLVITTGMIIVFQRKTKGVQNKK